jgi:hypothetical protein
MFQFGGINLDFEKKLEKFKGSNFTWTGWSCEHIKCWKKENLFFHSFSKPFFDNFVCFKKIILMLEIIELLIIGMRKPPLKTN